MANVGNGVSRIIMDADGEQATVTGNRLDVNATIGVGSATFISYPQFTAATSPTALSDGSNGIGVSVTSCKEIIIQADFDNTGYLMVGDSGATADTEGIRLHAGDTLILPISSVANVSIDASASSQNVNVSLIT